MSKSNGAKILAIDVNLSLKKKQRETAVKFLKTLLADEVLLYTKLRNYHWNVTGVNFFALHAAFETQFKAIAEMSDEIAERIRQYGVYAPGTMDEFIQTTRLSESSDYPTAGVMVENLLNDHEAISRFLREDIEKLTENSGDIVAIDLLTGFVTQHEKMAWMLRMYVYLEEKSNEK